MFTLVGMLCIVMFLNIHLQGAEMDLESQTRQMEHHNTKGRQLSQEARTLPQFEAGIITEDVDKLNKTWKNSAKVRM